MTGLTVYFTTNRVFQQTTLVWQLEMHVGDPNHLLVQPHKQLMRAAASVSGGTGCTEDSYIKLPLMDTVRHEYGTTSSSMVHVVANSGSNSEAVCIVVDYILYMTRRVS